MYKVYYLVSPSTPKYYIGMTKNKLSTRLIQHQSSARSGKNTPLYAAMRKYQDFTIVLVNEFSHREDCCNREIELIASALENGFPILNLSPGGDGGYCVPEEDKPDWIAKLKAKRVGRKPALGMKHSPENRELFSKVSKEYWSTQETYPSDEICKLSFQEAKKLFGISKTHYYRLLKRSLTSDQ